MAVIGFIGAGNMASAIIASVALKGILCHDEVAIYDVDKQKYDSFIEKGFTVCKNMNCITNCKYLFLAVKPQIIPAVLAGLKDTLDRDTVIVSIAAGITAEYIKKKLDFDCKIVLVMPNTPLLIGKGATAISPVSPVTDEEFQYVKNIFDTAGVTEVIPADKMNEIIPINGSSPALIYRLAEIAVDRGEKMGFSRDTAHKLFCNALIGSAYMMLEAGAQSHKQLISKVSSPGGTTLKLTEELDGLEDMINTAFDSCIKRAYELEVKD